MSLVVNDSLRGMFFILKGQQCPSKGDEYNTSGYDPESPDTSEWYQLKDNVTFNTYCCGSSLEKVLKGVKSVFIKYRTKDAYLTAMDKSESNKVSPVSMELYRRAYIEYGDYYRAEIEELEDEVLGELENKTTVGLAKQSLNRGKMRPKLTLKAPRQERPSLLAPQPEENDLNTEENDLKTPKLVAKRPENEVKTPQKEEKTPLKKTLSGLKTPKKLGAKRLKL